MNNEHQTSPWRDTEEATIDFNPLEPFSFEEEEEEVASVLAEGPFNLPNAEAIPQFQRDLISFSNSDQASERIEALFNQMPTLHHILFAILEACKTPCLSSELETTIEQLKEHHHCVYDPLTFCSLLERAGALQQTDKVGTPLADVVQEPLEIEHDGLLYWKAAPAPEVYWGLTEEGAAHLETYQPLKMIAACFENEPQYAGIFTTCLEMTGAEEGASMRDLGDVIDDEPVVQKPRRFAMYFIDKLEHAGAVEWKGQWRLTEAGRTYLENQNQELN